MREWDLIPSKHRDGPRNDPFWGKKVRTRDLIVAELQDRRAQDPLVRIAYRKWVNTGPARGRRKELGLTQREFHLRGEGLVSRNSIANLETGKASFNITLRTVAAYAVTAGVPPTGFVLDYFAWLLKDPRLLAITESIKEGIYDNEPRHGSVDSAWEFDKLCANGSVKERCTKTGAFRYVRPEVSAKGTE